MLLQMYILDLAVVNIVEGGIDMVDTTAIPFTKRRGKVYVSL